MICYMETNELKYSLYSPNSVSRVHNSDKKMRVSKMLKLLYLNVEAFIAKLTKTVKYGQTKTILQLL
jgi:hypothetical protein